IIVHVGACPNPGRTFAAVRKQNKKLGITLNPATPLETVEPYIKEVDLLLVMTVHPGFGGQAFLPGSLEKIKAARTMVDRLHPACELEVDGGIHLHNIRSAYEAGADVFVVGSA
ncbi:MAG TPA: ribulose-phosphate 3-epimerase, partial [Gemmatales bacterium]|nr:ribulose-phosphate 3-epimerase [Gemmatales bacterium]